MSAQRSQAFAAFTIPDADGPVKTPASELVSIRMPYHLVDIVLVSSECAQAASGVQVPELNRAIVAATGQKSSIRSECDALDIAMMPLEVPDECFASYIPELGRAVPTPTGKHSPVRAEGDRCHCMRMSPHHSTGSLAFLPPDAYLSTITACCPVASIRANSNREDGVEGFAKHHLLQVSASQRSILHLDTLQIETAQGQTREIEATQVPPQHT